MQSLKKIHAWAQMKVPLWNLNTCVLICSKDLVIQASIGPSTHLFEVN